MENSSTFKIDQINTLLSYHLKIIVLINIWSVAVENIILNSSVTMIILSEG